MLRLATAARLLSWIFYLVALMYVYAALLENQKVGVSMMGQGLLNTDSFFYIALGGFVLSNGALYFLIKWASSIKVAANRTMFFISDIRKEAFMIWLNFLNAVTNIMWISVLIFVWSLNVPKELQLGKIEALLFVGPGAIFILLICLPLVLFKK